jgi:hypothetical protein
MHDRMVRGRHKILHKDPAVVTTIINQLAAQFGKMSVMRGNAHVFLGMHIKYNRNDQTTITMKEYLKEAIAELGLRSATTPAGKGLFDIDENSSPLDKTTAKVFHSVTAKLLYVSTWAQMDLLLATSFHTTRVSQSTHQDLAKLKRLLEYVNGTMDDKFVVGADSLGRY